MDVPVISITRGLLYRSALLIALVLFVAARKARAQPLDSSLNNTRIDGFRGIWFELNQQSEYGDKYSGGLGTYTAKHVPMAIYAPAVDKTFFVYGGTTRAGTRHLLCMIGYYDHATGEVSVPTVVFDKQGVDDPHDNPSLLIDPTGHLWVFISGRGRHRPGFKFRSAAPYSIERFVEVSEEEMTYPQPWYVPDQGYFHFFTKYTGVRELYFETSPEGYKWTADRKLVGIRAAGDERGGHYQVSNYRDGKLATFFNRHPDGNVDRRTDLYYLQSTDFGQTWTTVDGQALSVPLTEVDNPARIIDYQAQGKNVYLKDLNFDRRGRPILLYVASGGHEPGPANAPREWCVTHWTGRRWKTHLVTISDHNYDMGSLYVDGKRWRIVAPTIDGPQQWGTGGEIAVWESSNQGKSWKLLRQITAGSERNHAYVRRPVNARSPFRFFWADGDPERFGQSQLYFGDFDGKTWQLPYEIESGKKTIRPERRE